MQELKERPFIFLSGLHRSGTSLLHEIIREHPEVSGFSGTGVPEDEGQHLQTVYQSAKSFGGPGRFVFDERSHMNESHPLATLETADMIFSQWSQHLDLSCRYIIEKSPPNIVRTRFLKSLYPSSKFITILRHPLAIAYATKKWRGRMPISRLLEHSLTAYEIFVKDSKYLDSFYILRYEEFVLDPQKTIDSIFDYLELSSIKVNHQVRPNVNEKYFLMWEEDRKKLINRLFTRSLSGFEERLNKFGYSITNYNELLSAPYLLGGHNNTDA